MKLKNFIVFTLTFLIIGCDGGYQSNDDEMVVKENRSGKMLSVDAFEKKEVR